MSESPVYVPPFVRVSRDLGVPLSAARTTDDLDDDVADDADGDANADGDEFGDPPSARATVREGLPPSYRMRHEPHYVEALVGRSAPAPASAAAVEAPAVTAEPAIAALPSDGTAPLAPLSLVAAAVSMADAFDAIQAALRDVPLRGRPLRDRVAIELARAEATRGRWLADAAVVMQTDPMPALDEVDLVGVLRSVVEALAPESRLSGGAAAIPVPEGVCPVFGDERLLTTAVGASLAAMRDVIEGRGDARKVVVTLTPRHDTAARTLEIAQSAVRLPASSHARFFDADWREHPAGASGALLLAAARRIAIAHGGALDIGPLDGGGCRLLLSVPAAD